jgi:hypothetical protein
VHVEFIARDTLVQWRGVSLDVISADPTLERLTGFLARRVRSLDDDAARARFAEQVPALLERSWEHVGEERVREYLNGAQARARAAMREYLP